MKEIYQTTTRIKRLNIIRTLGRILEFTNFYQNALHLTKIHQNRVRARGLLQCFLVALIFHEKGDCIVLLVPFASCATFTFVSFVSLYKSFVDLDRLEVAPFTSFLQILRTPEL